MSKSLTELETLLTELYSRERSGMNLDLGVTRQLLGALGDPQNTFKIVHVAGTNGKGSVSAMVANTLRLAGRCVGLYTSPHLIEFGERLQVDGQLATTEEIISLFRRVDAVAQQQGLRVTFFEAVTAMALLKFSEAAVEYAVIEVGLGGRLDATNVCLPVISAIVTIDFDHMQYLGDTLPLIAKEKAGIAKPNVPMVCGETRDEARVAIAQVCAQVGAPLSVLNEDFFFTPTQEGLSYHGPHRKLDGVPLGLLGPHQRHNAAVALRLIELLDPRGVMLSDEIIRRGFATATWPGRLERFDGEIPVLLDGAHNPHGARALRAALDALYLEAKIHLIFGASGDKPIQGMLSVLLPRVVSLTACQSARKGALEQEEILRISEALSPGLTTFTSSSVAEALRAATQRAVKGELVLVAGSLFVVGEARQVLLQAPAE